jgi:Holliday junction resolvase RusA-like endonuclease
MNGFIIDAKLPSLNDYTKACRSSRYEGARMKREIEQEIGWYICIAKRKGTLHAVKMPVVVRFKWYERTRKRDADNIASAKKFILDALVESGILPDDSRKFVVGFSDEIIDGKTDKVEVEICDC